MRARASKALVNRWHRCGPPQDADSRLLFPERRGAALLVHLERARLEFAGPFVTVNHDAGRRHLRIRKSKGPGKGPVAEEALARANGDRKDPEAKLVDEVVPQQRLNQVRAPRHLDLPTGLLLEARDGVSDVTAQQRGIVPFRLVKRSRG